MQSGSVGIRAWTTRFVGCQANGLLTCNAVVQKAWETFTVVPVGAETCALKTWLDTYLTADGDGTIKAQQTQILEWEVWRVVHGERAGSVAFLSVAHGTYLQVDAAGLVSHTQTPDDLPHDWESFDSATQDWWFEPDEPPFLNAGDLHGQLSVDGVSYVANSQRRVFATVHLGDVYCLHANGHDVEPIVHSCGDAGYAVARSWCMLNDKKDPRNVWACSKYLGVGPRILGDEKFVSTMVSFANLLAKYGMQWHMDPGGLDGINTSQEQHMFDLMAEAMAQAGPDKWALIGGVNEAMSQGTTDRDGDEQPSHLEMLINRIRSRHPRTLAILTACKEGQLLPGEPNYCTASIPIMYGHWWRGGHIADKTRHRFTQGLENGMRRLLWDGEGTGAFSNRGVPDDPLTSVSAQENGSVEAGEFDDESVALIGAGALVGRMIPNFMSSTGVRYWSDIKTFPGFYSLPRLANLVWQDIHTGMMTHGGRSDCTVQATTNPHGHLGRADQLLLPDGRVFVVLYGDHSTKQEETYSYASRVNLDGEIIHPGTGEKHPISFRAGKTTDVTFKWGRVVQARRV